MADAAYLEEATSMARFLTLRESRGPGDMENAWRRLETRYGIPFGIFWALRYRKPKGLFVDLYARLRAAYEAEHQRQVRILHNEIETKKQTAGATHPVLVEAAGVVRAGKKKMK